MALERLQAGAGPSGIVEAAAVRHPDNRDAHGINAASSLSRSCAVCSIRLVPSQRTSLLVPALQPLPLFCDSSADVTAAPSLCVLVRPLNALKASETTRNGITSSGGTASGAQSRQGLGSGPCSSSGSPTVWGPSAGNGCPDTVGAGDGVRLLNDEVRRSPAFAARPLSPVTSHISLHGSDQ